MGAQPALEVVAKERHVSVMDHRRGTRTVMVRALHPHTPRVKAHEACILLQMDGGSSPSFADGRLDARFAPAPRPSHCF